MDPDPQPTLAILADDLTSAADGAAPFVARGAGAWVGRHEVPPHGGAVVAVDSGSRSLRVDRAAAAVTALTRKLAARTILYKTVDSTLRGHVAAELAAAFAASGRRTLVFAPAFPEAGRTTMHGVQRVHGVPVAKSVYGCDPVHPARHSALAGLVPVSVGSAVLIDASTQDELDAQIAAIPDPETVLWVGSPGMATALARRFRPVATPPARVGRVVGGILVAVGSANPQSHRQADRLAGVRDVTVLRGPVARQDDPGAVLDMIATTAATRLAVPGHGALIATGGDTVAAILDRLGLTTFEILRELEPGLPLGRARLADGRPLLIVMKAGEFGNDASLLRVIGRLRP